MIKQNLHTHSRYDDGKDEIDTMVRMAIDKGFTILGFSGHGTNKPIDICSMTEEGTKSYLQDIAKAKEKYKGQIDLYCGIEQDAMKRLDCTPYDYVIGSVHFVTKDGMYYPIDYSPEKFEEIVREVYGGDIRLMMASYFEEMEKNLYYEEVDIIGHVDLLTKYNEDEAFFSFSDPWYLENMKRLIQKGIDKGKIFEMNTGAISRGYRKEAYPHDLLLEYMGQNGSKICINTDCHDCTKLDTGMQECVRRAKQAGFKELYVLEDGEFVPRDIELFVEENE